MTTVGIFARRSEQLMKTRWNEILGLLCAILLLTTSTTLGQSGGPFTLNSPTVAGGGGTCARANFSVSGTVGQPDTGARSGGAYSCEGGLWPGLAPSSPCSFMGIQIARLGNGRVRVSWPLGDCGYVLYYSAALPGGWAPLPPPYTTNATHLSVVRSERAESFLLRRP
jgi:hypothetical protein